MCGNWFALLVAAQALARSLQLVLALRSPVTNDEKWSKVSPDKDPEVYRDALDALYVKVLPKLNAIRAECDMEVAIEFEEMLLELLLVESSVHSYRFIFKSAFDVQHQGLGISIGKTEAKWWTSSHPCELASTGLDVAMPLMENDRFIEMGLRTLTEITEEKCGPQEIFVPKGVLDAVMVEGTRNEQVVMHVMGPLGPHRVHFEFSGAKVALLSSDVPVCKLAVAPTRDTSIMQIWGGLSAPELRAKRMRRFRNEISKRARTFHHPAVGARLPTYRDKLESSFHWADVMPECFGYGPEVQDQGYCGASWAFSTLGALSDRHCLAYGRKAMSFLGGGLTRFSVQDFLSCHPDSKIPDGCRGGTLEYGVRTLTEKTFAFEDQSPYFSKCYLIDSDPVVVNNDTDYRNCSDYKRLSDHPANNKPCACWRSRPRGHGACDPAVRRQRVQFDWGCIPGFGDLSLPKRVELIMRYIREGGPVAASFTTWDDFRAFVLFAPDVPYHRSDASAQFRGGHAVILTGWGTSQEGIPYWWARNSWGTDWGKRGYFKIARGLNSVGLENHVFFSIVQEGFARRAGEHSHATFGIRSPWSNDLAPHRGQLVREVTPEPHRYRFVPSGVDGGPIIAVFRTEDAKVNKDVYTFEGTRAGQLIPGHFFLLAVEIPFECSEPCVITSSERYQSNRSDGTMGEALRFVEAKLDDDSWSRGRLVVYIDKEDPLQGTSESKIKVTVQSRQRQEILLQLREKNIAIDKVKDWHLIPLVASDHSISLPTIPVHKQPTPLPEPIVPLQLILDMKPVSTIYYNYLRVSLYASEASSYHVRVIDKRTKAVVLASVVEQPPDRVALLYIGGNHSIGGFSFQSFFDRGGKGFGKTLSLEVDATCDKYAKPAKTTESMDIQWPRRKLPPLMDVWNQRGLTIS